MRVLYVASDLRDADILQQEVRRATPDLGIDICPGLTGMRARQDHGSYDIILMDGGLPEAEQLQLIHFVRVRQLALPIIVLSPANGPGPGAALSAGADDFISRGPKAAERLHASLRQSVERYRTLANTLRENDKLKRSEARLRLIIEALPTGVLLLDQTGKVLAMNAAGVQYFGSVSPQDIVGRQFATLIPVEDQPGLREFLDKVTAGEEASLQFSSVVHFDETPQVFNLRGLCIQREQGGQSAVLGVIERVPVAPSAQHTWSTDFDLGVAGLPSPLLDPDSAPMPDLPGLPAAPDLDDLSSLTGGLTPVPSRVEELESRCTAAESRAATAEAELASLQATFNETETQQRLAAERLAQIEAEATAAAAERDTLRQELTQAETRTREVESTSETRLAEAGRAAEELRAAVAAKDAAIAAKDAEIAERDARLAEQQSHLAARDETIHQQSERLTQLDTLIGEKNSENDTLANERAALQQERDTLVSAHAAALLEKDALLATLEASLREKEAMIAERDAAILEKDALIAAYQASIADEDALVAAHEASLRERDVLVAARDAAIRDRENLVASHEFVLRERDAAIAARDAALADKDGQLAGRNASLADKEAQLAAYEAALRERDEIVAMHESALREKDAAIAARDAALTEKDLQLASRQASLAEMHRQVAARDASLADKDGQIAVREASLADKHGEIAARDAALREREAAIADKDVELAARATQLAEMTAKAASLEDVRAALDRARKELEESRAELVSMSRTLAAQREAQEDLQATLTRKQTEMLDVERRAQTRITELEREHRSVSARLQELLEQASKESADTARGLAADPAKRGSERVGRLAAAMAGDLHAAVGTAAEAVKALTTALGTHGGGHRDAADRAMDTIQRCGELARHLLRLSARYMSQSSRVDLGHLVRQQDALLHHLAGPDIELNFELAPGLVSSDFDSQDITHLLTSLMVAARDALPLGGAIRVSTASQRVDGGSAAHTHDQGQTRRDAKPERPRPLMLSVTAKGYGIRPVPSTTCEEVTERCGGVLTTVIEPNVSWTLTAMLPGSVAAPADDIEIDLTRSA